jgi:hypothetical protein
MPERLGIPKLTQEYPAAALRALALNIGPDFKPLFDQEAPPWKQSFSKAN